MLLFSFSPLAVERVQWLLLLATLLGSCLAVHGIGEGGREWPAVLLAIRQGVFLSLNGHQISFNSGIKSAKRRFK